MIRPRWMVLLLAAVAWLAPAAAQGAWYNNAWRFRRPVKVIWDEQRAAGSELCQVEFPTASHALEDGSDIRVATVDGRLVPFELLGVGPGDVARVVFQLQKGQRDYFIYFGNPDPAPVPDNLPPVTFESGLLMELKPYTGQPVNDARQLREAFDKIDQSLGRIMIERPFIGHNPFGDEVRTIGRLAGSIFAPIDGTYTFAQATDDRGALFIDDEPIVYSTLGPADTRHNGSIELKRGRHRFVFYHVNFAGAGWLTVGWKRPDSPAFDPILRESFGIVSTGIPGALEELRKTLTADFSVKHKGEFFFLDRYTQRYAFSAYAPKAAATYEWDFGDGQTASGQHVEHVYLEDGVYPVRLTVRIGNNADTQTTRMMVRRDYANITNPAQDKAADQSAIVAGYDIATMPAAWLAPAVQLHLRADDLDAAGRGVQRLARLEKHPDADAALSALEAFTEALLQPQEMDKASAQDKASALDKALAPWFAVPTDSDLQPRAAMHLAELLLWREGEGRRAVEALRPFKDRKEDAKLQRLYGQALILDRQPEAGAALLRALKPDGAAERHPALSGALARTIEFYITENDPEAGEIQWERWQESYPADFLEGYSVLLRVRLMQLRHNAPGAARIAAAFAQSLPQSPYAPRLLDFAWRALQESDPQTSAQLHALLKDRYPEDPLAQ